MKIENERIIYFVLFILLIVSCQQNETDLYRRDKYHIEHAFLSNVESLRLLMSNHPKVITGRSGIKAYQTRYLNMMERDISNTYSTATI